MPTKPNKREEIGTLPDKEFQIIIVKIIQNLENKIELQIIAWRQELRRFNKSLTRPRRNKKESINNE